MCPTAGFRPGRKLSGLTQKRATDIRWRHVEPLHWDLLVQRREWSRAAYADWRAASLRLHILGVA